METSFDCLYLRYQRCKYLTYKEWKQASIWIMVGPIIRKYLTYKELKPELVLRPIPGPTCKYLTYKEWKLSGAESYSRGSRVSCKYLTYKEWKPSIELADAFDYKT